MPAVKEIYQIKKVKAPLEGGIITHGKQKLAVCPPAAVSIDRGDPRVLENAAIRRFHRQWQSTRYFAGLN